MANLIEKIKDKRAPAPETPERRDVPIVHPDPQQGLTSAQVRERTDAGWTNAPVDPPGKTVKQIVLSNIFTYFNMLFFLLALCVIAVQQWLNLTFMGVIIVNTAIGIIQEIRSKKTLDKLNILASPKAVAVRDGRRVTVDTAQLVRDDIVVFAAGNQIYADAVVAADSCYVNEALITGESDEIKKNPGDKLLSGSFVVSGMCRAQLTDVGADSYVSRLTQEAKRAKKPRRARNHRRIGRKPLIVIGSIAARQPSFISAACRAFSSPRICVRIDTDRTNWGYRVLIGGPTDIPAAPEKLTDIDLLDWARRVQELGAGEVLLYSRHSARIGGGYDIYATGLLGQALKIPVIAEGGEGKDLDFSAILAPGVAESAVTADALHSRELDIPMIKQQLIAFKLPVRLTTIVTK